MLPFLPCVPVRQRRRPRISWRSGDSESSNVKSLCLLFQFFVQLSNLILVCGVVQCESLKKIIPVKCRFCGLVGEVGETTLRPKDPEPRGFFPGSVVRHQRSVRTRWARLTASRVSESSSFKSLADLSFFFCSCLTALPVRIKPPRPPK